MYRVSSTRFLGVIIDEKRWKEQIDFVCKQVMKSVGIIRKICPLVNKSCLLTLYCLILKVWLYFISIIGPIIMVTLISVP